MLTKTELKQIENLIKPFIYRLEESQDDRQEALDQKIIQFKSAILDAVDSVMGEIKKVREEQTLIANQIADQSDKLESHEEIIDDLRKKITYPN